MGSPVTLDANVVIGFLDPTDSLHARARAAIDELVDDALAMPSIAYAETMVRAAASGMTDRFDAFLDRAGIVVGPVQRSTARLAVELRAQFEALTLADAIVLAWARERRSRLVTFDKQLAAARDRLA